MTLVNLKYVIAMGFTVANIAGAGFALGTGEPTHAAAHVLVGGVCAWWATRVAGRRREQPLSAETSQLELLESEVSTLRQELLETQERLDFAERMLVRDAESRRPLPPQG